MLIIVLLLVTGILAGLSIGMISAKFKLNEGILTFTIYLILFMLAFSIGVDDMIVRNIDKLGWNKFLLILGTAVMVTLTGWILFKILSRKTADYKLFTTDYSK